MKKIAVAWLLKEDWPRWQAIDPELPPYDGWLAKISHLIGAAEAKGLSAEKVNVDPSVFAEWCKANGKPINRDTRAGYAAAQVLKPTSLN